MRFKNSKGPSGARPIILLKTEVLEHHPWNMRLSYPPDEVAEMRDSIRRHGVKVPLRVVPKPHASGRYLVVDGNMRLEGASAAHCRKLPCVVERLTEAQQLIEMAVINRTRYAVAPVDEARHFQLLMEKLKCNPPALAAQLGIRVQIIYDALLWLKLEPEIQALVNSGQISKQALAARALLELPSEERVALAKAMAGVRNATLLVDEAQQIKAHLDKQQAAKPVCRVRGRKTRAAKHAAQPGAMSRLGELRQTFPESSATIGWDKVKQAAALKCETCLVRSRKLAKAAEPAWSVFVHAAEAGICADCDSREVMVCHDCDVPRLLELVAVAMGIGVADG